MSEVRQCDKCEKMFKQQDGWVASWKIEGREGELLDEDESDICGDCRDDAVIDLTKAINKIEDEGEDDAD